MKPVRLFPATVHNQGSIPALGSLVEVQILVGQGARGHGGKMIVGLKIVSVDGSPITFKNALLRFVALASMGVSIGFLWLLFDRRKQSLHDKAGRTVVVKIRDRLEANESFQDTTGASGGKLPRG